MKLSRNARRLVALTLSAALVLGGVAVNGSGASAAKKATLKLSKKSAKLAVGKKLTLKVKKKNVKSAKITWKSSKKSVASVSKKGVVKAKKAGKTKISATIRYKAKGSKKSKKKTLKCTVTVMKKSVVASKAPAPSSASNATKAPNASKAPGGDAATASPAPGGDAATATPAPGGDAATATPAPGGDTATATPAPGGNSATATPTPAPGGSTSTATPAPSPVQSLKISVKDGETVLKDAVVTIKNSADQAITATKGEDGIYTTDKLVAGKYTISVAELAVTGGKYTAVSKEVNIAEKPASEVQEVDIAMVLAREDEEIYASTAGLFVDSYYPGIKPGYKYENDKKDSIVKDESNSDNPEITYALTNISKATVKVTYTKKALGSGDYNQLVMNGKEIALGEETTGTVSVIADVNLMQTMALDGLSFTGKNMYVNKITITVQERYEGAYMHMFVGEEVKDQMTGILANGQYTFTYASETPIDICAPESDKNNAWKYNKGLYLKCCDTLPQGVKITVDKVTMDDTEYSVDKLSDKLYKDGVAQDIVTTVDLKNDGAVWYNSWDDPIIAPSGFDAKQISKTSITITVSGFPEN